MVQWTAVLLPQGKAQNVDKPARICARTTQNNSHQKGTHKKNQKKKGERRKATPENDAADSAKGLRVAPVAEAEANIKRPTSTDRTAAEGLSLGLGMPMAQLDAERPCACC